MQSEYGFSNLIYDYFIMRIRFQYYKEGDQLPAIDALCREFCVADQTVRAALRRMRAEGYISMHNGRPTRVIFRQSQQEYNDFVRYFYGERREAFHDLLQSAKLLFTPLLTEAFSRIDKKDHSFLIPYIQKAAPNNLLHLYSYVFQNLNNSLLMNLFWEFVLFEGFPLLKADGEPDLYDMELVRKHLLDTIKHTDQQDMEHFTRALGLYQRSLIGSVTDYIKSHAQPVPIEKQISFTWRIYRDHPQICYALASYILYAIYLGEYRNMQYLPSYEKLAERVGVSLSTMRRTIRVLNHLGAVRTINGKGTLIFKMGEPNDKPDLKDPIVRRNLAYFFQAYEIIVFSCREVVKSTFSVLDRDKKSELLELLKRNRNSGRYDQTLWRVMLCIADCSPLMGVREVYSKIYGLFLWGYPLKVYDEKNAYLSPAEIRLTSDFIRHLEEDNVDLCAAAVYEFVVNTFTVTEKLLLSLGLRPEELRISPTIRLLTLQSPED